MLSSHAELVQKHVCLPSSASQCLTMVSLAGTETAFLERLAICKRHFAGKRTMICVPHWGWMPETGS